jgi:hypothetical protein
MSIDELLRDQDGVVSRAQVLQCGHDDGYIEARVRRRDWARIHTGVYVDHTGPPSWTQRLWAALLFYGDSAACDESALVLFGLRAPGAAELVHVAVDQDRRVTSLDGVRLHRITDLASQVHPNRQPPRLRLETAVLRAAARCKDDASAVAVLANACQSRRTTAERLALGLGSLPRLPRRALLLEILVDVAEGAFSVLEHRYLTRVERPHGLPTATRQRRVAAGRRPAYRDVEYLGGLLVVELDGRLGHEHAEDRWSDLDRDIDSAVGGSTNVRLTWGQVLRPCRTAAVIGRLLQAVGWRGRPKSCSPSCRAVAA